MKLEEILEALKTYKQYYRDQVIDQTYERDYKYNPNRTFDNEKIFF